MKSRADDLGGLVLEVFRLNGCLIAEGDRRVAEFGLSSARWQVLGAVARSAEPQSVSQLARETGASRQAVQRLANSLAESGLVELTENPRDRRAQLVRLTEAGRSDYAKADRVRRKWLGEVAAHFEKSDVARAKDLLARLRTLLADDTN